MVVRTSETRFWCIKCIYCVILWLAIVAVAVALAVILDSCMCDYSLPLIQIHVATYRPKKLYFHLYCYILYVCIVYSSFYFLFSFTTPCTRICSILFSLYHSVFRSFFLSFYHHQCAYHTYAQCTLHIVFFCRLLLSSSSSSSSLHSNANWRIYYEFDII